MKRAVVVNVLHAHIHATIGPRPQMPFAPHACSLCYSCVLQVGTFGFTLHASSALYVGLLSPLRERDSIGQTAYMSKAAFYYVLSRRRGERERQIRRRTAAIPFPASVRPSAIALKLPIHSQLRVRCQKRLSVVQSYMNIASGVATSTRGRILACMTSIYARLR